MTRPNNVTTNYSYDKLSHLLSVLHQLAGSTIDGATYTVDNAGNRTAKTDDLANVTTSYNYDPIYELLTATQGVTTESYTYDPVGNRLSSLGLSPYSVNTSNELTSTPNASYTYDNNGNTASKTNSSGTTNYSWDYENRLTSVTLPNSGGTVSFKYDPFGRRIEKISPSATSIFAYDGDNVVETVNGSGGEVASYAQGQNIDEPLAMDRSGTVDYYEQDGVGSVTSLTASSGSLAQTYTYDSFGNQTASSGSLTNFFRYTGREFDTETNLYFNRARYYDFQAGRFVNEDPVGFLGSGTNFYRYVDNNPINLTDSLGLCPKDKKNCLLNTLEKNGVALTLDAAGYIPGEGVAVQLTDIGVGIASTTNSAVKQDATGTFMGIASMHLAALEPLGKAVPVVNVIFNTIGTARDLYVTIEDYRACTKAQ
ncbi:MAG TPA: RHS repeat-associated core domain-containing protein [Candidatus Acidoferrum sp.]|nr:RHS repeat-associated core domain-containing protein [Candidatus Acidoferrum sp.]